MTIENRIFLAHAGEDKPQVRQLYDQLKARGFDPWLDEVDLIPGQNWREEIPKAIHEATICLACLSKRSIEKRSYVQREFRYALSAYADLPPGSTYLIPVRLDDCKVPDLQIPMLELSLRDLHWVDLFDDDGFEKLVGALERTAPTKRFFSDFEAVKDIDAPWCPELVTIPAGTFLMGSPNDEEGWRNNEGPQHEVTISQPFALGRHTITFDEYDRFCDETEREKPDDRGWGRGRCPVIRVNHEDAEAYCAWLSEITKATYQLPTEAMWEYACRAGTTAPFSFGSNITTDEANYDGKYPYAGSAKGEYRRKTVPVGSLPANPWGFFEMHGNVWEWCADGPRDYTENSVIDFKRSSIVAKRVLRGGSWLDKAHYLRSARRNAIEPNSRGNSVGFRCARVQEPAGQ